MGEGRVQFPVGPHWKFKMVFNIKKFVYTAVFVICFGVAFGLGVWFGVDKIAYHVPQPGTIDFSLFWDSYNQLKENFINPDKITDKSVIYGAIQGMTSSLEDPYTFFFPPEKAKVFEDDLSGSFDGIGVEIGIKKDFLTVVSPLKGTPGENAGLKAGDIIVKINGKDSISMSTDEAVDLIRGPKGTKVTLTIMREGWEKTKDFEIIRDTIKIPSANWSLKDGNVAYMQVYQFGGSLPNEFAKMASEILQSSAKKIVLDLRNNPGGYLEVAQEIAGWFLEKGQVVTIEDFGKEKPQTLYKADGNSLFANFPMVILINEGSASASEILAGALRDNRKIKLVGNKSFGKGSVQQPIELRDGSLLKVTIAHWLTPKGSSISEVGLAPDIKVDITDNDIKQKNDSQLQKALEIIANIK